MKITPTRLPEVLLIEPKVFSDERGFFYESFSQRIFDETVGYPVTFVQDNHSQSQKNVLRGLHYQMPPHAQGKLVRVVEGEVFDVAVDIRKSSPRFGQWVGVHLSAQNKHQLWIPEGFAHGFYTISERAQYLYKLTHYYVPAAERCVAWNDKDLGINWHVSDVPAVSAKDELGLALSHVEKFE